MQITQNANLILQLAGLKETSPVSYKLLELIAKIEEASLNDIFEEIQKYKRNDVESLIVVSIFILIYFYNKSKNKSVEAYKAAIEIIKTSTKETAELTRRVFIDANISFENLTHHLEKSDISNNEDFVSVLRKLTARN